MLKKYTEQEAGMKKPKKIKGWAYMNQNHTIFELGRGHYLIYDNKENSNQVPCKALGEYWQKVLITPVNPKRK